MRAFARDVAARLPQGSAARCGANACMHPRGSRITPVSAKKDLILIYTGVPVSITWQPLWRFADPISKSETTIVVPTV